MPSNFCRKIIWSDKSKFELINSKRRQNVWKKRKDGLIKDNIAVTVKHSLSVMLWGRIFTFVFITLSAIMQWVKVCFRKIQCFIQYIHFIWSQFNKWFICLQIFFFQKSKFFIELLLKAVLRYVVLLIKIVFRQSVENMSKQTNSTN
jgi:hypothetical protein